LFPFAFHCTGMPIAAAVLKLKKEYEHPDQEVNFVKQSKILEECGVPSDIIKEFTEPQKWLDYFPDFGKKDLQKFGLGIDWRRSFITTSHNKFYDAFI